MDLSLGVAGYAHREGAISGDMRVTETAVFKSGKRLCRPGLVQLLDTAGSCQTRRLVIVFVVAGLIHGCETDRGTEARQRRVSPASAPASATAAVDLVEGPLTTFERACSRCHGPQGSFFGEHFAKLNDEGIYEQTEEMMRGPAQLDPDRPRVEAMAAFLRALRDHRPFICVTNAQAFASGREAVLRGEVTPGASVVLEKGLVKVDAGVEQRVWTIASPPQPPFVLRARAGDGEVKIDFPARGWSQ